MSSASGHQSRKNRFGEWRQPCTIVCVSNLPVGFSLGLIWTNGVGDLFETQFVVHGYVDLRDHAAGVGHYNGSTHNSVRAFAHMHPNRAIGMAFDNRKVNIA